MAFSPNCFIISSTPFSGLLTSPGKVSVVRILVDLVWAPSALLARELKWLEDRYSMQVEWLCGFISLVKAWETISVPMVCQQCRVSGHARELCGGPGTASARARVRVNAGTCFGFSASNCIFRAYTHIHKEIVFDHIAATSTRSSPPLSPPRKYDLSIRTKIVKP